MSLKLHKTDGSPPSRSAMMVIDLVKAPVELVEMDMFKMEHHDAAYIEKNPLHTVPILEIGDFVIFDSHAIMAYLVDVYGIDDSLYPKDPLTRAKVNQILFFDTGILFARAKTIMYSIGFEGVKTITEKQITGILETYNFVEEFLKRNKWVACDHLTIADISVVTSITAIHHVVPIDKNKYPKIASWLSEIEKEPFYQKFGSPGDTILRNIVKNLLGS